MPAGRYWIRLQWLVQSEQRNPDTGGVEESWTASATRLWARIPESTGGERVVAGVLTSQVDCVVEVRGFPAVGPKDRLKRLDTDELLIPAAVAYGDEGLLIPATRQRAPEPTG